MLKVNLEDMGMQFGGSNYIFILGLGFDLRCLTALNHFPREKIAQILGISNVGWGVNNERAFVEFNRIAGDIGVEVGREASSIIELADALVASIKPITDCPDNLLVVDVTSFSHELLVVLLGLLYSMGVEDKVTLVYVGASDYSFNTQDDAAWLSRGVRSIRSVLGFPGTMLPSKKLHLVVLAGFEVERAAEVIGRYEPSSISIGLGNRAQSVSDTHHDKNRLFFDRLTEFVREQDAYAQDIDHFEFSCVDPLVTKQQLLSHIESLKKAGDKNIVICPLNTKLSTVGVVLVALENPEIQICYAEPDEYNVEGYSKPGSEVSIVYLDGSEKI